jgi:phosphatidylinositol glycan class C protein
VPAQAMTVSADSKDNQAPWEKILYRKQPYDDNYVDEQQFLEQMRENADVKVFEYWECVRESAAVSQHLCIVVIFIIIFKHLWDDQLSLNFMLCLDGCLFLFWILCLPVLNKTFDLKNVQETAHSVTLFIVMLLLLSPVMHTLTYTFSNDTIWALAILFLFIHVFCNDYRYINGLSEKHTGVVAVNAATFSSVLLASRLPSSLHAFSILALSMLLFGLYPILRHHLKKFTVDGFLALTWVLFGLTTVFLALIMEVLPVLFGLAIGLITFVFPSALISAQKAWKLQIKGPWDEAKPPLSEASLLYAHTR